MGRAIAIRYEIGFSAGTSAQQLGGGMLPPALPLLPPTPLAQKSLVGSLVQLQIRMQ